jgi:hypothetical protein
MTNPKKIDLAVSRTTAKPGNDTRDSVGSRSAEQRRRYLPLLTIDPEHQRGRITVAELAKTYRDILEESADQLANLLLLISHKKAVFADVSEVPGKYYLLMRAIRSLEILHDPYYAGRVTATESITAADVHNVVRAAFVEFSAEFSRLKKMSPEIKTRLKPEHVEWLDKILTLGEQLTQKLGVALEESHWRVRT